MIDVLAAIFGPQQATDRELALDFLLCYIVDALHDGRLVITHGELNTWRSQAQARRQWGSIYDAQADDEGADLTLRVNWKSLPDYGSADDDDHDAT